MQDYSHEAFTVAGYKISTTNKDFQSRTDIMNAWKKWREENLGDLIIGKNNPTLHCIYFNYQNSHDPSQRSYDMLIGYTVDSNTVQTSDLITTLEIPAQKYKYDTAKGEMPMALVNKWKDINEMTDLDRTFGFDMDMYVEDGVMIAVSVQ